MADRNDPLMDSCQLRCLHLDDVLCAREELETDRVYADLAAFFAALADPTRARIVHVLQLHELCTCDLSAVLGITESAVSQHLRLLRALRLVRSRREGKFVFHSLDDDHVASLVALGLSHQREQMGNTSADTGEARTKAVG